MIDDKKLESVGTLEEVAKKIVDFHATCAKKAKQMINRITKKEDGLEQKKPCCPNCGK